MEEGVRQGELTGGARERELNLVEDEFIAELFRLTRFADVDLVAGSVGLGRTPPGMGRVHGVSARAHRAPPPELEMSRQVWLSLSPAQQRRILAKTLACLSLPSVTYFQDAALFLLFVRPTLAPIVHSWVEHTLLDSLALAPSELTALHKVLIRVLYGVGGYARAAIAEALNPG
ncbi:hypothetical protein KFE25_012584 [Diacronema lutheri]|uniref:Uncharacterized protein n=2 Tax=Diacronema lutheri TaxID=2081491 RepID=A0A8J5XAX9_DIALT|nr:hypothetical protein KFE25_012584 [Diacronema lutheri]